MTLQDLENRIIYLENLMRRHNHDGVETSILSSSSGSATTAGDLIFHNGTSETRLPIGNNGQVLTVNSAATAPEWTGLIGAKVYHSTTFAFNTATLTTQDWDRDEFDTNNFHNTVTNNSRITIPVGMRGYYFVHAVLTVDPDDNGERHLYVTRNGTTAMHWYGQGVNNAQYQTIQLYGVLFLEAGDYLETRFEQNTGFNINSREGVERSFFEVIKLK